MKERKIPSKSVTETKNLASKLSNLLEGGEIISLEGGLGAGKTVFVSGLIEGLRIKEQVTSPTFVILKQYKNSLEFNHFDAYRISEKDFIDLGYRDFFYSSAVSVIEWGDRIKNLLPEEVLIISIDYGHDENQRLITVKPKGAFWEEKVDKWLS